jgi:uncharacterized membrane protein YhhN
VFKPLTIAIIILIAMVSVAGSGTSARTLYPYLIIAALVFCLAGDVCLMFKETLFTYGLIGFAIAHVLYSIAFLTLTGGVFTWWLFGLTAVIGTAQAMTILPYVKKIKVPVLIYIILISVMIWLSWERLYLFGNGAAWFAAVGSFLFGLSDTVLAINRFKGTFKSAELIILGTYYPAVWCIAISVY